MIAAPRVDADLSALREMTTEDSEVHNLSMLVARDDFLWDHLHDESDP